MTDGDPGTVEPDEPELRRAAEAGDSAAAFSLAQLLDERGRPDDARRWYEQVAAGTDIFAYDASKRLHERRLDDAVRSCVRAGDGPGLWRLLLSRPLGEAVRIARHLRDLPWRPDGEPARSVAQRLLAETGDTVVAVTERATRLATRVRPAWLDFGGAAASEARGTSTLALATMQADEHNEQSVQYRVTLVDPEGGERVCYTGPKPHSSLAVLDDGVVMAVRESGDGDVLAWELVRYADGGELSIANGIGAPYPRLASTQQGYVLGLRLSHTVVTGTAHEPPVVVDLSPAGLRHHTDCCAVDPTGTRIAFADTHVLVVTDTQFRGVIAQATGPAVVPASITDVVFPAPDTVITSGGTGLCRWRIEGDSLIPVTAIETRAPVRNLFAVPAWGIVAGGVSGPNLRFFDIGTLEPLPAPTAQTVVDPRFALFRAMVAPPGGRYVVYGGLLRPATDQAEPYEGTAIYDTRHPLSWVHRPPAAFSRADVDELGALLAVGSSMHPLAADERPVLELLQAAARCHLAG